MPFTHAEPDKTVDAALASLIAKGRLKRGDAVVVLGIVTAGDQLVDAVTMRVI